MQWSKRQHSVIAWVLKTTTQREITRKKHPGKLFSEGKMKELPTQTWSFHPCLRQNQQCIVELLGGPKNKDILRQELSSAKPKKTKYPSAKPNQHLVCVCLNTWAVKRNSPLQSCKRFWSSRPAKACSKAEEFGEEKGNFQLSSSSLTFFSQNKI